MKRYSCWSILAILCLCVWSFGQGNGKTKNVTDAKRGQDIMDKAMLKFLSDHESFRKNFSYTEERITIKYNFSSDKEEKRDEKIYLIQPIDGVQHQRLLDDLKGAFVPIEKDGAGGETVSFDEDFAKIFDYKFKEKITDANGRSFFVLTFEGKKDYAPTGRSKLERVLKEALNHFQGTIEVWADTFTIKKWSGSLLEEYSYSFLATAEKGKSSFEFQLSELTDGICVWQRYDVLFKVDIQWPLSNYNERRIKKRSDFKKVVPAVPIIESKK